MKTDDLILRLAADARPVQSLGPAFVAAVAGMLALTAGAFLVVSGVRADLGPAALAFPTVWKWLLPGVVALVALPLALRLSRPEARTDGAAWLFLVPVVTAAALVVLSLAHLPAASWPLALRGQTWAACVIAVPALGLLPLVGALSVLRRGATTAPRLAGALAGLGCGGAAAAVYSLHCIEDSPVFFVTWYGLGILVLGLLGAAVGGRMLRW